MVCHFQEPKKVEFIKEHSVVSPKISERVDKLTVAVRSPTEPAIVCFTLCSEELSVTIAFSSLSTSPWTLLWKATNAEELWPTTWQMEQSTE